MNSRWSPDSSGLESFTSLSFTSPRPAPSPPIQCSSISTPSICTSSSSSLSVYSQQSSSPLSVGFALPPVPPTDCPLHLETDVNGQRQFPCASKNPLPVDHDFVIKLIRYRKNPFTRCTNCAQNGFDCEFSESGVPCPPCAVLGIPDCLHADPEEFLANISERCNGYLLRRRDHIKGLVNDNYVAPSQFQYYFDDACSFIYSAAQGAIDRFAINARATSGLILRGYHTIAASSTDIGFLSRFLSMGNEAQLHPSVTRVVSQRLTALYTIQLDFQSSTLQFQPEQDIVLGLHNTLRTTHYDDPVDQDAFLVSTGRSVLQFRPQITSFASNPDLAECVFALRSQMQQNNTRLTTPPSDVYNAIVLFAGEIVRKRHLLRDRKRAQVSRLSGAAGAAARAQRRDALRHAKKINVVPDDDSVSIPSSDEELDSEDQFVPALPRLLITAPDNDSAPSRSPVPVRLTALLSPLAELESLMFSIRLSSPTIPPPPPPSPNPSLPSLVQIDSPLSDVPPRNDRGWTMIKARTPRRVRVVEPNPRALLRPIPSSIRIPISKSIRNRPPTPRPPLQHSTSGSALQVWKPNSAGFPAHKNISRGKSRPYEHQIPSIPRNPKPRLPKRCFHCLARSHLLASCPLRNIN
ncbi:hypothetical protein C8R45DRAFT_948310 [Mycena sanguinolenta]|nr:hypothetical protein C8R45DRAFT_948310 [Mycena sanguinolenta]